MQKDTKNFIIDGKYVQFDSVSFKNLFTSGRKKADMSVLEYETELGEALSVSSNAIHNWRFGMNGPSDLETIKQLAECLDISDYMLLLKDGKENMIMQISKRQKDSLKRLYDAVIEYLDKFQQSDGFNNYWHGLCRQGVEPKNVENMLYEIAEAEQHKVELVLSKEYIELHELPVYSLLEEFVYDDLGETYNGKLSYAYRFEAGVENIDGTRDTLTTDEDYTLALKKINDILEAYM